MQARTHQLLVHNKELLEHIQMLVMHLQEMERQQGGAQQQPPSSPRVTMVPQVSFASAPHFTIIRKNRSEITPPSDPTNTSLFC